MGCPGGMSTIWCTRSVFTRAFRANFSLRFPRKTMWWEKKIVVPCLDVIMIAFFPRNIQWSSLFARKARVNTERVPPGHPIILLKSNEFNMAAVWVERSIENFDFREIAYPRGVLLFKSDGGVRRNISRTPPKRYQKLVSWACRTANWINFCLCCRLSSRPEIEANLVPMAFA